MKGSLLSLSVSPLSQSSLAQIEIRLTSRQNQLCAELEQHIGDNSTPCSWPITQQWLWSNQHRSDADKMCSLAQVRRNVGCESGLHTYLRVTVVLAEAHCPRP